MPSTWASTVRSGDAGLGRGCDHRVGLGLDLLVLAIAHERIDQMLAALFIKDLPVLHHRPKRG